MSAAHSVGVVAASERVGVVPYMPPTSLAEFGRALGNIPRTHITCKLQAAGHHHVVALIAIFAGSIDCMFQVANSASTVSLTYRALIKALIKAS